MGLGGVKGDDWVSILCRENIGLIVALSIVDAVDEGYLVIKDVSCVLARWRERCSRSAPRHAKTIIRLLSHAVAACGEAVQLHCRQDAPPIRDGEAFVSVLSASVLESLLDPRYLCERRGQTGFAALDDFDWTDPDLFRKGANFGFLGRYFVTRLEDVEAFLSRRNAVRLDALLGLGHEGIELAAVRVPGASVAHGARRRPTFIEARGNIRFRMTPDDGACHSGEGKTVDQDALVEGKASLDGASEMVFPMRPLDASMGTRGSYVGVVATQHSGFGSNFDAEMASRVLAGRDPSAIEMRFRAILEECSS